jgi:hypothetical protein
MDFQQLEIESAIGFEGLSRLQVRKPKCFNNKIITLQTGKILNGIKIHPDRMHMVYAIGCNLIIEHLQTRRQEFLVGHNNNISCIAISRSGKYIASGQVTYMGFKVSALL